MKAARTCSVGTDDLVCEGHTARFHTADTNRAIAQLVDALNARDIEIIELHVQKASLEDVFLELTSPDASVPDQP